MEVPFVKEFVIGMFVLLTATFVMFLTVSEPSTQTSTKIPYGERCSSTEDERCAVRGSSCQLNKGVYRCLCGSDRYLDTESGTCKDKIPYGERCRSTEDDQCLVKGSSCQFNRGAYKCVCGNDRYLDTESVACKDMPYVERGYWEKKGELWDEQTGEKWILKCASGYEPSGCHVLRNFRGEWNREIPSCQKSSWMKAIALTVVAGVGAVYAAPAALAYLGFTSGGIAASSVAAYLMSLGGGTTAAGGIIAALQSAGVIGFSAATTAAIGGAASTTAAATQYLLWHLDSCEAE